MLTHLGIIADGNRRWAKSQGLPTIEGHKEGLKRIEELTGVPVKFIGTGAGREELIVR